MPIGCVSCTLGTFTGSLLLQSIKRFIFRKVSSKLYSFNRVKREEKGEEKTRVAMNGGDGTGLERGTRDHNLFHLTKAQRNYFSVYF